MKYKVSHKGEIAQIVKTHGGTITVKPGAKDEVIDVPKALTEEQIEHYKALGVTFKSAKGKPTVSDADKKKAEIAELEKAVEDAKTALEAAEEGDAKVAAQAALEQAETALTAAQS
ncbi:hypothetical protein [uncultured Roseibium sp.]|uniref:hypothetical protein n=1 Tax=uncultured Roseibium sp. TaxID=1936171 RepID=UPI0026253444|nr:hypothetical protein [uncultured Roseibium sp.]